MTEIIKEFILSFINGLGYFEIFLLMLVESSFVPFPSEIVIPPAAYLAFQGELNIVFVVLLGVLGSLFGASINYFLSRYLGRKVIYKLGRSSWAKYFLINEEKIKKSEMYFKKYGNVSTFFGRLIPAVRQFISIPAGFVKMPFFSFMFFTALGAGLWILVLAMFGWFLGANEELMMQYFHELKWGLILVVFSVLFILFFWKKVFKKR